VRKNTDATIGATRLPLASYPLFNLGHELEPSNLIASLARYFLYWLDHPNYDEYWKRWSIEDHFGDITVPALHIAAWYDIFLGGSLRNYIGLKERAGSDAAKQGQRLVVMIGGHSGSGRKIGDVDFGAAAVFDDSELMLSWYDYLLQGLQNEFATKKAVRIFVMGTNQWREEDDWPLSRARAVRHFLHSAKSLSITPPSSETEDSYLYEPSNPVPTVGGPLCCDSTHLAPGPRDQRKVESRDDVLSYSMLPFAQDVEITGPVTVELYAKSTAADTDFTAKLVDVWPDGFVQNLTEGIVRARYRDSREKPTLLHPGEIYRFNIDLWSTSNVFRKGHVLRLEISSSNFPRFDRNLNTGEDVKGATRLVPATNTILHDKEHPSALVLPIVPRQ
jgi:putative CocE/NonD family hydrolase